MVDLPGRIGGILNYFETAYGMIIWANIDFEEKHRRAKLVHGDVFLGVQNGFGNGEKLRRVSRRIVRLHAPGFAPASAKKGGCLKRIIT